MKLATGVKSTVASQGVKGSSGFAISNSAHMFSILSDGLYSDKIGAVLREIGANAMDAHIMSGKSDMPFEVKLPSRFDSTFHVKDFGPGLDDQEVRELYTTYGWSSKQNSNEVTGAFGLGSKSPFAYTDSFSICSVKDGVKRVYTAHKDDEGKPVVSLLSETAADDDWQAGIMVTFAVAPEDVNEFTSKAARIYRWFKVVPTIIGAKVDCTPAKFTTRGSNFAIGAEDPADKVSRVVMANVAYPLHASRLDGLDDVSLAILNCNVHLFLPTGSVMPTPNREDLQYDKQSRPAIAAALKAAAQEVAKEIYDRVNEEKSLPWEWHRKIQQYAESLPSSIRYKIREFLSLVTSDKEELVVLEKLFNETHCVTPNWIGDGRDAPRIPALRDEEGAMLRDPVTQEPLLDKTFDVRGCRVWYYWVDRSTRGGNPIKRKEVINGHIRYSSSGDPSELKLSFTDEVQVFVADAGRADMRVKWMLDTAGTKDHKVLMVQPVRGADAAFVEAYADKLAGSTRDGLGGLTIAKVSSVDLPLAIIERAKSTRLTLEDKRELFLDESRGYFSLTDSATPKQMGVVGDFQEDSDKFYVLVSEQGSQVSYRCHRSADDATSFAIYSAKEMEKIAGNVAKLRAVEGKDGMTGFFALRADEVRHLKLREAGWKPAMVELVEMFKDVDWQARLATHVDLTPELRLTDKWGANQAGYAGLLARHSKIASPFFGRLKSLMPDHPMILLASRLAAKAPAEDNRSPKAAGVEMHFTALNQVLDSQSKIQVPALARMEANEIRKLVIQVYPSLELLDYNEFYQLADSVPEMAASLFWQFAYLDSYGEKATPDVVSKLLSLAA